MKTLNEFIQSCNNNICLRNTFQSKRCKLKLKQERCYKKYEKKYNKDIEKMLKVDIEWEEVKKEVLHRDNNECQVWKILTASEKHFVLTNFLDDYTLHCELDIAHIEGKGAHTDKKYNVDNLVCISRYFHSLLDSFKDPITRKNINEKQRKHWFYKIKRK